MNPPPIPPWSPSTTAVTEHDLHTCPVLVLHYWAVWNSYDRDMDRRLATLQSEYCDRICFRSCNTDRAECQTFVNGIANIPALGCFIHGQWSENVVGLRSEDQLRDLFDGWIAAAKRLDYARSPSGREPHNNVYLMLGLFVPFLTAPVFIIGTTILQDELITGDGRSWHRVALLMAVPTFIATVASLVCAIKAIGRPAPFRGAAILALGLNALALGLILYGTIIAWQAW